MPRTHALPVLLVAAGVTCFALNAFAPYYRPIDDAYISYRYAKNLAHGDGLVWNPGEAPVEGYTNFLLVVVEAPFIALGFDPLRVAQTYGLASIAGIAVLLWVLTRQRTSRAPDVAAALSVLVFLGMPFLAKHALIGLETVTFSFHLLLAYWLLVAFIRAEADRERRHHAQRWFVAASAASFVAGLSRPEGFVVCGLMLALCILIHAWRARDENGSSITSRRLVGLATVAFVVPTLAYHAWRYVYFGDLRPNSFHIKVAATGGGMFPGLPDLIAFVTVPAVALLLLCSVLRRSWTYRDALLLPGILFPLFYARSQHIMAFDHRFFVPYVPFLVLSGTVSLAGALLSRGSGARWIGSLVFAFVLAFAFVRPSPAYEFFVHGRRARPTRGEETHFMLGKLMATLPDRHDLLVVGPDAGAMSYFSEARWIDPIGLNDNFLARNAKAPKQTLIDYLFSRNPDIWILCVGANGFVTSFPGPLGKQSARIHDDPRFARYADVASHRKNSGGQYDYHFYVRRDVEQFAEVSRILRSKAMR